MPETLCMDVVWASKVDDILRWSHSIYDNDEMYVSDVSSWGAELINQHAFKLLSLCLPKLV